MNLLMFYINGINGGGAARVMIQLAERFAGIGYHIILVTSFVKDEEYLVPEDVTRISLEQEEVVQSKLLRNVSRIWKLRLLVKQYKPLALISFMAEPNIRALFASICLPVKNIVSVRNDPNKEYNGCLNRALAKFVMPVADGCVFQTEEAKAWFSPVLQRKSRVIMNEVAECFFEVDRLPNGDIITIGRLSSQKNQEFLIRAFVKIATKHPDRKLRIYGSGELEKKLDDLINELGMQDRVFLMGSTTDVPSALSEASVFVLSSDYEGMPNALMEALAAGVPSISTDCPCGGPAALIRNSENGILVSVGNEDEMACALDSLLSDSLEAERIGSNARERAKEFHPNIIFNEWRKYVESIVIKD